MCSETAHPQWAAKTWACSKAPELRVQKNYLKGRSNGAPFFAIDRREQQMHMKISNSIMSLVFLAVGTSVLVSTMLFLNLNASREKKASESRAEATAQVFSSAVAEPLARADTDSTLKILTALSRMPGIPYAAVRKKNGQLFAELGDTVILKTTSESPFLNIQIPDNVVATVPIVKSGTQIGTLEVVADTKDIQQAYWLSFRSVGIFAFLAALASMLLAMRLLRYITFPILALTAKIELISKANGFVVRTGTNKINEIAKLEDAFSHLMVEVKRRGASLEAMAFHDSLTSLGNRRAFQKHLEELVKLERPFCVILADIDHFQSYNQAHGHHGGDAILVETAARLKSIAENGQVFRIGGDEFAAVLDEVDQAEMLDFAARLSSAFVQQFWVNRVPVDVSTTFGAAHFPEDGMGSDDLIRNCGLALRQAKSQLIGKFAFYTNALGRTEHEEEKLAVELKSALKLGELELHYQMQVNLRSSLTTGFEALVRWKHAEHGYISPAKFVPLAERHGLIVDLGNWVFKQACQTLGEWLVAGHPAVQISINVSIAQLQGMHFISMVRETLQRYELAPQLICLEITETMFAGTAVSECSRILGELRNMGCSIALDDFGTGYSSLSYLHAFPIDKIKIDRSFVTNCDSIESVRRLLTGTVQLARTLGFDVVVEGVETRSELAVVSNLAADYVQGYVFSRPLPIAQALVEAQNFNMHKFLSA
jgi:diguanylate cyclase (GGDEF)-like protein